MANLNIMKGDVTNPHLKPCIIPHVCNDVAGFGSGVAGAIAKKWPQVQKAYFDWATTMKPGGDFYLGQIQVVKAEDGVAVCNMIGQRDIGAGFHHIPPIRYEAVNECLYRLCIWLNTMQSKLGQNINVIAPKFGCGLAGGKWERIEQLIQENLVNNGFDVYVYDF